MSTNMGNLEKLGILVIVILVVVVGVVAMTPKSTVDERLYPEQQAAEAATPPETLEPVASDVKKDDVWPVTKDGPALPSAKPLPGETLSADPKSTATPEVPTTRTIKVQAGDTLPKIAKRETGNAANFKQILDLNPGLVPSKLKPGMEIKVPGASASTAGSSILPPANPAESTTTPEKSGRVYVVKAGDTLSSIATHEMHSSKWADLAKANEDVLHGSTSLKVGMKLTIPGDSGAPSSGGSSAVASHDTAPAAAGSTSGEHEYVVKNGDTLWGIAKSEMGGEASVKDLRAANQDVLKGSDALKVGMKLKIPAKK